MHDPADPELPILLLDGHVDTPQRFADESWDFSSALEGGMLNADSARAGHLSGAFLALWPEPTQWRGRYACRTLTLLDAVLEQARRHPRSLRICTSPADIEAAHRDQVFSALLGIEGGHAIENSLAFLRLYHRLGVRYMTLTWANSNDWAESSTDVLPERTHGLTPFGHQVIAEMNRLGMMVDLSHVSTRTFEEAIGATRAPVIASHSCAQALCNSPRNLSDAQLHALAANGGVCMVNFYPAFIDDRYRHAHHALKPERDHAHAALASQYRDRNQPIPYKASLELDRSFAARIPRPPLASLLDHFDHILRLTGPDHTGFGSDFDGIPSLPQGIDSAADLPRILTGLRARGHSSATVAKIAGGNLLRVFKAAQAFVKSLE